MTININSTNKTPAIVLDAEQGILRISGRCIPENALTFFDPIIEGFELYLQGAPQKTVIELMITHINTSSYNLLLDLLKTAEEYKTVCGLDISVKWYHDVDDEDLYETANDTAEYVKGLPFNILATKEENGRTL